MSHVLLQKWRTMEKGLTHWTELKRELEDSRDAYEAVEVKMLLSKTPPKAEALQLSLQKARHIHAIIEKMQEILAKGC